MGELNLVFIELFDIETQKLLPLTSWAFLELEEMKKIWTLTRHFCQKTRKVCHHFLFGTSVLYGFNIKISSQNVFKLYSF